MAEFDLRSADQTINKQIPNGLPGEAMRKSMENKNILKEKGSLYVGTGAVETVEILGDNYLIAQTGKLTPGSDDMVLVADSTNSNGLGLSYKNVEDIIGGVVRYDISPQGLNVTQKTNARTNIGAAKEFTAGTGLEFNSNNSSLSLKIGDGLNVNTNNSLSLKAATASTIGGVKIGDGLNVNSNSSLSLKAATTSTIGGVKIGDGSGLDVDTGGALSLLVSANGNLGGIKVSVVSSLPTTLADDVFYFVTT